MKKILTVIVMAAAAFISTYTSAEVIDTTVGGISPQGYSPFGSPDTATYGQTFTVGSENVLQSFSLFLKGTYSSLDFRGYVGAWDGSKVSEILYTSVTQTIGPSEEVEEFVFDTGNLILNSGSKYVAFLSISELGVQNSSQHAMPLGNDYSGGNFVYFNNGFDFLALTTRPWTCLQCFPHDVAFKAILTSSSANVPEPATMALLGLGLLGFAASRRKKAIK